MFKKKINEIEPPPISKNVDAKEVARIWRSQDGVQQITLLPTWKDPAAWGILLIDLAKHAAKAYEHSFGADPEEVYERIMAGFDAERENPTDSPKRID